MQKYADRVDTVQNDNMEIEIDDRLFYEVTLMDIIKKHNSSIRSV